MREQYQTPQKERSRPSLDFSNRIFKESPLKKTLKVPAKSLNVAFRGISVDLSHEFTKEPADLSPVSKVSDANCNSEIDQGLELELVPAISASSEPFIFPDLTPSSTITDDKDALSVSELSPDHLHHRFYKSYGSKLRPLQADVAVSFLERARIQVSNSVDTDTQSKMLLDALITTAMDELQCAAAPSAKRDACLTELVLMKTRVLLACYLICILVVIVILFLGSGSGRSYVGPLPT